MIVQKRQAPACQRELDKIKLIFVVFIHHSGGGDRISIRMIQPGTSVLQCYFSEVAGTVLEMSRTLITVRVSRILHLRNSERLTLNSPSSALFVTPPNRELGFSGGLLVLQGNGMWKACVCLPYSYIHAEPIMFL